MKNYILLALLFNVCLVFSQSKFKASNYPTKDLLYKGLCTKPLKLYSSRDYVLNLNVNDSIKSKLKDLLDFHWSIEEIENYLEFQFSKSKVYYDLDNVSSIQSKYKNYQNYINKIIDYNKIRVNIRNSDLQILIKNELTTINPKVVFLIGSLLINDAKPKLYSVLKDSIQYPKTAVELALIRLGDSTFENKYLKSSFMKYDSNLDDEYWLNAYKTKSKFLYYINTQKSISLLGQWLDTSKNFCTTAHNCFSIKASNFVVYDLASIIRNTDFIDSLKAIINVNSDFYDWSKEKSVEVILYCKKWLINNYGKYDLEPNYVFSKFPGEN